jgi:hypothetical protein
MAAAEEHAASLRGSRPTLYLHGSADGCIGLKLEQPGEVNGHILAWVTGQEEIA